MRKRTIIAWLAGWAVLFAGSVLAVLRAEVPLEAIRGFALWQLGAGTAATVLWCLRPRLAPASWLRRAAATPALLSGGLVLALVALLGLSFLRALAA